MRKEIYTIGHSTRSIEEFLNILKFFRIQLVVDVRRFPTSKKVPWFNKENLEKRLKEHNIEYVHFPRLGGFRKGGYLAFSKSEEFSKAVRELLKIIGKRKAAIMCTELLWWKCHRRYIANYLTKLGYKVIHIFDSRRTQEHKLRNES
ncbi:DUF488 domain-containing protein [Nanoarchaeota archaeon]|nr:MAG: DUF488 domain-containing protein [Nanoarchaeota archaeon]